MLATWPLDPIIILGLASAGWLYARADRRVRKERGAHVVPHTRSWCFLAGLAVIFVALQTPLDVRAATSFSVHMVQHLLLTMVAAPLLVLGAPVTLALVSSSRTARRRLLSTLRSWPVRALSSPILAWALFMVVLWGTHFSGIYELTLQNQGVHVLEHLAYLASAVLFWIPVVGLDPAPSGLSHPARILYLFLAMPSMAFLGLAILSANHVLYPTYGRISGVAGALADQRAAGAIMWAGTMFLIVPALAFVLLDWMRSDEKEAARIDARLLLGRESAVAHESSGS
ncbi:MAG: cytochrome c oxidase assembly protein [Actinomycetota bacterium]|nr:cytochrome c oxidase assembly protein [Actinomycetota bacterium]